MKIFERGAKETIYKVIQTQIGIECDICKERILAKDGLIKPIYYSVTTGQIDWDNDCRSSVKHHDICPHCLPKFAEEYLKDVGKWQYIKIEREVCRKHESYTLEDTKEEKKDEDI